MHHGAFVVYEVISNSSHQEGQSGSAMVNGISVLTSLPLVIVGNKVDLLNGSINNIAILEGKQWSNKIGVPFYLTDANSGSSVEIAFISSLARCLYFVQNQSLLALILSEVCATSLVTINDASKEISTDANFGEEQVEAANTAKICQRNSGDVTDNSGISFVSCCYLI